jgi:quinoprotein glucose dehydrogenase
LILRLYVSPSDARCAGARVLCATFALLLGSTVSAANDWPEHGHDKAGTRFSPLRQITTQNVDELEVAWTYSSGEIARRGKTYEQSSEQSIPILVEGRLVLCTPFRIVALDPASGAERWVV